MTIESTLRKIGLNKSETTIYLSLLKFGGATGYQVAKDTGLKKPTVYSALDELRKKGLVVKSPQGNKFLFVPKDPRILLDETKQTASDLESVIPSLLSMSGTNFMPHIAYYEGTEGFDQLNRDFEKKITQNQEVVAFFAYTEKLTKEIEENTNEYLSQMHHRGAQYKMITPDHTINTTFVRDLTNKFSWQLRHLPIAYYPAKISIETTGTTTILISTHKGQAMMIENDDLASFMRSMFEMMWNCAEYIGSDQYPGKHNHS